MKGMDMMAARIVMPLGTEQANVLQAPTVTNEGQDTSFAKSFGEVASGAVGMTLAGQTLNGSTAATAKGAAPVGVMEKLPYISVGDGLKETSARTSPTLAKSGYVEVARAPSVSAQSSEELENVPRVVSVDDGSSAVLQNAEINVSVDAVPVPTKKPLGPIVDAAGIGTKIDSIPFPLASKVAQPLLAGDADQSAVQKKEVAAVSTGKPVEEKPAKKELKDKGNFPAAAMNVTSVSIPVEGPGTQVATTVPTGVVTPAVTKAQEIATAAGSDANASAALGEVGSLAGGKAVKGSPYGANSGVMETSALGGSKDGAVTAAKADNGIAGTKKVEADSSKTVANAVTANGVNEESTRGIGGAAPVSAVHGVLAVTGNVTGDTVAAKASVNANSVAAAAGQDGTSQGGSSVSEGHRTLEATPTSLEVGVANGTQGWLKIRAEMTDGGVVNASVSATTSAGQEMLHRELPSLTAYLQQEQIGVASVVLHTTAAAGPQEFAGGMERDAGREQQMQQRGSREGESQQNPSGTTFSDSGEAYVQGGLSGIAEITTNGIYAGGSWLSVRA